MFQILWIKPNPQSLDDWDHLLAAPVDQANMEFWHQWYLERYPDKEFQVVSVH